uniref:Uncharacterized protein n=1 Tax=Parascaris univalens TaxID=6257 RepID=A0A915BKJ2_PARUN
MTFHRSHLGGNEFKKYTNNDWLLRHISEHSYMHTDNGMKNTSKRKVTIATEAKFIDRTQTRTLCQGLARHHVTALCLYPRWCYLTSHTSITSTLKVIKRDP